MDLRARHTTSPSRPRAALASGLLLLTGGLALSGCTTHGEFGALRQELSELRAQATPPTAVPGYIDLRGAIHVHSHISRDSEASHAELLGGARSADLDFVVMTEHETPAIFSDGLQGWREGVLAIQGMEVIKGCRGMADRCATLLAVGIEEFIDTREMDFQEVVDEVHRQGGLAFIAHPRGWRDWSVDGIDGLEIYDILDDALDAKWKFPKWFFDIVHSFDEYGDEVFLQIQDRPDWHLRRWDELSAEGRMVAIAGNDAHQNVSVLGHQLDPYARSLGFVNTHVWAWGADQEAVLSALAEGHAYVSFDRLADATGFWFATTAVEEPAIQGDEVSLAPGLEIVARAPLAGRIRLLRGGEPVGECHCSELVYAVEEAGVYRVEVELKIRERWRPWIFSNPLYVRAGDGS